jgi:hypothetical protein
MNVKVDQFKLGGTAEQGSRIVSRDGRPLTDSPDDLAWAARQYPGVPDGTRIVVSRRDDRTMTPIRFGTWLA